MDTSPAEVLAAGQALLAFAQQESHAFSVLLRLLDPAVVHEMETEHQEFARDLELLEWLVTTTSESPDAAMLAESLARRMHQHVARDGRLLARAAVLVSR
ncbi:MAG TPA: hypothetical protein VM364_17445 [Vicinamibacterales bacterium]|nr:hypothetical protein [Vicinamibacterales bacterium]